MIIHELGILFKQPGLNGIEPVFVFFKIVFPEEQHHGKIIKCWRCNSQTVRRNFPTLQRNFLKPWQNYIFVHYFCCSWTCRVRGEKEFCNFCTVQGITVSPLCQSSVRMVSQNPRKHFSLATSFLDFWTSNISGLRQKKKRRLGFRHIFCTQHLSKKNKYIIT